MIYGQVTKYEAGVLYRAMKENKVKVLPETIKLWYDKVNENIRYADERYQQNRVQYNRIYKIVENIVNNDYEKAQEIINEYEKTQILTAGKKSSYYKYKKETE